MHMNVMRGIGRNTAVLITLVLSIAACGGAREARPNSEIISALNYQYNGWRGVPYKEGGLTKKGIDCSGYVHLTFKQRFGIETPRSTKALSSYGRAVGRRELQAGDLVFFKTGWKTRHVGIYMYDGRFMHASTSSGVMVSSLDEEYWDDAYWHSRRVM